MSGGGPPLDASKLYMHIVVANMLQEPGEQPSRGSRNAEGRDEGNEDVGGEGDVFRNTEVQEEERPR